MSAPDYSRQFHIAVDTSETATGGVVFQLVDVPVGTQITNELMKNMRILMFLSFKLEDAETRYTTGERETLGVTRSLREIRPWIIESPYPTIVYTDHHNMLTTLSVGGTPTGRIAQWIDDLNQFDVEIAHRPNTTKVNEAIGLAASTRGRGKGKNTSKKRSKSMTITSMLATAALDHSLPDAGKVTLGYVTGTVLDGEICDCRDWSVDTVGLLPAALRSLLPSLKLNKPAQPNPAKKDQSFNFFLSL